MDLWSYKDDYVQPIQKVRAERDRNRTFTAAYLIPERKIVQLADTALETVTPSESAAMGDRGRTIASTVRWPITTSATPTHT